MKYKLTMITLFLLASVISAAAQTAADLTTKYGEPVRTYTVSEHIWMTPEYTADGQVCQMRLYPRRIGDAGDNYLSNRLPFQELRLVLNELAPPITRGVKKDPFGQTATGGGAAWTTYAYEKVSFVFISSFKIDPSTVNLKPYVFSENLRSNADAREIPVSNPNAGDNDFLDSEQSKTEIVTVVWNGRTCTQTRQKAEFTRPLQGTQSQPYNLSKRMVPPARLERATR